MTKAQVIFFKTMSVDPFLEKLQDKLTEQIGIQKDIQDMAVRLKEIKKERKKHNKG